MKKLIVPIVLLGLSACTSSQNEVKRVLAADGVTEITLTGYDFFTCGNDTFSSGFKGVKNGKQVSGAVCAGWLKGYTIRYR